MTRRASRWGSPTAMPIWVRANIFPHEANLDQLGGVSFTKGCYVGQEVVSRMEHRGTARSRILPVELDGDAPPREREIRAGDKLDRHPAVVVRQAGAGADPARPAGGGSVSRC